MFFYFSERATTVVQSVSASASMAVAEAAQAPRPLQPHDDAATRLRPCGSVVVCCCWGVVVVGGVGAAGEEEGEDGNAEEVGENAQVAKSVEVSLYYFYTTISTINSP